MNLIYCNFAVFLRVAACWQRNSQKHYVKKKINKTKNNEKFY